MFEVKDIVQNGKNAEKFLAKYPYAALFEKNYNLTTAVIGKLAEKGVIDIVKQVSDKEWNSLLDEVEKEVVDIRRNGRY